ncbi:MAG: S41 family peptidase [Eubacteriales bacterium]|nr:S41 family peptidase [Eubacteriales bacterium]
MTQPEHENTSLDEQRSTGSSHRRHGSTGRYVLTVLITMILTFALTISGGFVIYLAIGNPLAGLMTKLSPSLTSGAADLTLDLSDDEATRLAIAKFKAIYSDIDQNYYKDLSDAEMVEAMARGLVNEMDSPYTMYLGVEQTQEIADSMAGNYVGIGAIVAFNANGIVEITEVIPESPAESAGIQVGDLFMAVDDKSVEAVQTVTDVAILVRGVEGTEVALKMYRPATHETLTFNVMRKRIVSASISHKMLNGTIGYVRMSEFSSGLADQFRLAVDELQAQGAVNIVFDLRNNSGGLATEVIDMLDYLLPEGEIARIEGRSKGIPFNEKWTSDKSQGVPPTMRYAILVNEFTASASELFSGCLRDYDLAELIGEQTFGKGSGTLTYNLDDGSSINVTNFLYYLPDGDCIEGEGITPDQELSLPEAARYKSIPQLTVQEDNQLAAAIDYLLTQSGAGQS